MARYDVFPNPSSSAEDGISTALCPVIVVNGKRWHALAHYAAPLPARLLKRPVDNVAAQASALVLAMDAVLSGL
jgi:toxin CcdB